MKNSRSYFKITYIPAAISACAFVFIPSTQAENLHWNADVAAGSFFGPGNWLLADETPVNRHPQNQTPTDYAFIGSGAVVGLNLDDVGGTHNMGPGGIRVGIKFAGVDWIPNGQASMTISGAGTLNSSQMHIGRNPDGDGSLVIASESKLEVENEFWVGRAGGKANLDAHGTIDMTTAGNRFFEIGDGVGTQGTTNLHPGSSVLNLRRLWVGRAGGTGFLNVHDETTFQSVDTGTFREFVLGSGIATVDEVAHVSHGTLAVHEGGSIGGTIERFWIGELGGTGVLHLNGGTITKPAVGNSVIIGENGANGTVEHDSGTFTINHNLLVGNKGGATGVYHMRGGQLTVTGTGAGANSGLVIGRTDGTHGTGAFNLSGGTVTTTPVMIAGAGGAAGATAASESTGHLAITGGDLRVSRIFGGMGSSSALFNGGRITVTGASTSENQFMQDIKAATVGANGLNVDTSGFDIYLTQNFNFTGGGAVAFSNSATTPTTVAFHGLENIPVDEPAPDNYSINIGSRVTLDIAIGELSEPVLNGPVNGAGSLVKSGAGILSLLENGHTGDTAVNGGALLLGQASLGDTSTVSVADGAQLFLSHGQTDVVGALILDGVVQEPGIYNQGNSDGLITGTGSLNVIPPPPPAGFAGFMDGYADELPDEADREAGADPDGDGITNLMEYALGLDPTVPGSLPSLVGNTITFAKGELAVESDDVTYIIETSPTLGAEPTPWVAVTPAVNNDEEISYTLPAASPGSPRNFVRLRVELAD